MRKIKHFVGDTFLFHEKVLQCKKKGEVKTVVKDLSDDIRASFSQYDARFSDDTLEELEAMPVSEGQKDALISLYSFRMKPFQELFITLTTDENNRISKLCPNCTVGVVESLDHCLPKTEFPEYSDNPLNLIPCCMHCNGKKTSIWRKDGKRIFLNLFLDELPKVRYLFITTNIICEIPVFIFSVDNRNRIDEDLFSKIESHYKTLDLCKMFSENSDAVVDDLALQFKSLSKVGVNDLQIKQAFVSMAKEWQDKFGYNYWKSILIFECCSNDEVFKFITKT